MQPNSKTIPLQKIGLRHGDLRKLADANGWNYQRLRNVSMGKQYDAEMVKAINALASSNISKQSA